MLQQIVDLKAEAAELNAVLQGLSEADWDRPTLFKDWTIKDVVIHLHATDLLAAASIEDATAFDAMRAGIMAKRASGLSSIQENRERVAHLSGGAPSGSRLLARWQAQLDELCALLAAKPVDARLRWAGPDMGVRMFATARQMEVWAHGQEVFDALGLTRTPTDRLRSIAEIGVRTYGWTFANRAEAAPGPAPHVRLTAPSGAVWEWNPPSVDNAVSGPAADFCQVVTQVRNVADTALTVTGEPARRWMAVAQCFAGPPETPPAPGSRRVARRV